MKYAFLLLSLLAATDVRHRYENIQQLIAQLDRAFESQGYVLLPSATLVRDMS